MLQPWSGWWPGPAAAVGASRCLFQVAAARCQELLGFCSCKGVRSCSFWDLPAEERGVHHLPMPCSSGHPCHALPAFTSVVFPPGTGHSLAVPDWCFWGVMVVGKWVALADSSLGTSHLGLPSGWRGFLGHQDGDVSLAIRTEVLPWPSGWRCPGRAADTASSILPLPSTWGQRKVGTWLSNSHLWPWDPISLHAVLLTSLMAIGGTGAGPHTSVPFPEVCARSCLGFSKNLCHECYEQAYCTFWFVFFLLLFGKNFMVWWVMCRYWECVPGAVKITSRCKLCHHTGWAKQVLVAPSPRSDFINTIFQQRHNVVLPSGWKDPDLQEKFLKVFFSNKFAISLRNCFFVCVLSAPSFDCLWRFEYISVLAKKEILHSGMHAVSRADSPDVVCSATEKFFFIIFAVE